MLLTPNVSFGIFVSSISTSTLSGNFTVRAYRRIEVECELFYTWIPFHYQDIISQFVLLVMKDVLIGAFPENSLKEHHMSVCIQQRSIWAVSISLHLWVFTRALLFLWISIYLCGYDILCCAASFSECAWQWEWKEWMCTEWRKKMIYKLLKVVCPSHCGSMVGVLACTPRVSGLIPC